MEKKFFTNAQFKNCVHKISGGRDKLTFQELMAIVCTIKFLLNEHEELVDKEFKPFKETLINLFLKDFNGESVL